MKKTELLVLDYSPYDNDFDRRSDALIVEAATSMGVPARIEALDRQLEPTGDESLIWLRFDLRSRSDFQRVTEVAEMLEKMNRRVFPNATTIRLAEDKWETFRVLQKAGVAIPQTFRGCEAENCAFPAIFKTRVGWGGLGKVILQTPEELAARPESTRAQLQGPEYICQNYIEHDSTLIAALTVEGRICCIEDAGDEAFVDSRGPVIDLPESGWEQAELALRAIGLVAGTVDLLRTPQGEYLVLEVNAAPRLTYPHLPGVDLAKPMVRAVLNRLQEAVA